MLAASGFCRPAASAETLRVCARSGSSGNVSTASIAPGDALAHLTMREVGHDHGAAETPTVRSIDGSSCCTCVRANAGPGDRQRSRQTIRGIHSGFLWHLASVGPSLVRTPGVGPRSGDEPLAKEWREQLRPASWGLQESYLAAMSYKTYSHVNVL